MQQARGMAGAPPSPLPGVLLIGFGYYPISSAALLFGQSVQVHGYSDWTQGLLCLTVDSNSCSPGDLDSLTSAFWENRNLQRMQPEWRNLARSDYAQRDLFKASVRGISPHRIVCVPFAFWNRQLS